MLLEYLTRENVLRCSFAAKAVFLIRTTSDQEAPVDDKLVGSPPQDRTGWEALQFAVRAGNLATQAEG